MCRCPRIPNNVTSEFLYSSNLPPPLCVEEARQCDGKGGAHTRLLRQRVAQHRQCRCIYIYDKADVEADVEADVKKFRNGIGNRAHTRTSQLARHCVLLVRTCNNEAPFYSRRVGLKCLPYRIMQRN